MDDFIKRLWITGAFLLISFNMIHFLMLVNGGYLHNWLFFATSKLVWLESWILKISLALFAVCGSWWFVSEITTSIASYKAKQIEDERIAEHNKKATEQKALYDGYEKQALETKKYAEAAKEEKLKKQQAQLIHEKFGPRKEEDALKKALDSINYGGQ